LSIKGGEERQALAMTTGANTKSFERRNEKRESGHHYQIDTAERVR
jgi:hypothetical protein